MQKDNRHPLRLYPHFRRFFIGNILLSTAARSVSLIFCWWIISQTSNASGGWKLGVLMTFQSLPYLLFSSIYGPLIDRYNKKSCILTGATLQLLVSIPIALTAFRNLDNFWLLCLLIFIQSSFMPLVDDSCNAIIPWLVNYEKLPAAAATQASVFETSNIAAALLSTTIMSLYGIPWALLVNSAVYLTGTLFVLGIRIDFTDSAAPRKTSWLKEFKNGWSYIAGNRSLLSLSCLYIAYAFFLSQTFIIVPLFVKHVLDSGVNMVGLIEISFSATVVAGTLFVSGRKIIRNVYVILGIAVICSGIIYILLANLIAKLVVLLLFLALGAVFSVFWSLTAMLFQIIVSDDFKGRFFSLLGTAAIGITPLSYLLVGYLAELYSIYITLVLNGILLSVFGIMVFLIPRTTNIIPPEAGHEH